MDAGRLQMGETPSGDVLVDALGRLSDLINTLQTQGLKLWLNQIQSITLTAGTADYSLGPSGTIMAVKPLRAVEGWFVAPDGQRRPLMPLALSDYYNLGNLTQEGAVNSFLVDKQLSNLVIRLWQVPDATAALGRVDLLLQTQAIATPELDETVSFPVEWFLALRWSLADELASGQPQLIIERCMAKAREYRAMLEGWDVEDASTRFQPNTLGGGLRGSRFR